MIPFEQLEIGIISFIKDEMIAKVTGAKKWALGLLTVNLAGNLEAIYAKYKDHPAVQILGIVSEDGMVDADKLLRDLKAVAQEYGPISENLPLVGSTEFSAEDIDLLHKHVKKAG